MRTTRVPDGDRRRALRFPIERLILFQTTENRQAKKCGIGQTINISSTGVLFCTDEPLIRGQGVSVAISWPARLDSSVGLQLVAQGRVVRCDGSHAAIRIQHYEFRTRAQHSLNPWTELQQLTPVTEEHSVSVSDVA
jgi:hypothetical protein